MHDKHLSAGECEKLLNSSSKIKSIVAFKDSAVEDGAIVLPEWSVFPTLETAQGYLLAIGYSLLNSGENDNAMWERWVKT